MKKMIVILPALLLVGCKPACSALDVINAKYAAEIQDISAATGQTIADIDALLVDFCNLAGEPAVDLEIQHLEKVADAIRAKEVKAAQ